MIIGSSQFLAAIAYLLLKKNQHLEISCKILIKRSPISGFFSLIHFTEKDALEE